MRVVDLAAYQRAGAKWKKWCGIWCNSWAVESTGIVMVGYCLLGSQAPGRAWFPRHIHRAYSTRLNRNPLTEFLSLPMSSALLPKHCIIPLNARVRCRFFLNLFSFIHLLQRCYVVAVGHWLWDDRWEVGHGWIACLVRCIAFCDGLGHVSKLTLTRQ